MLEGVDSCQRVYQKAAAMTASSLFLESVAVLIANGAEKITDRPIFLREWSVDHIEKDDLLDVAALVSIEHIEAPMVM